MRHILYFCCALLLWQSDHAQNTLTKKINGISFVSNRNPVDHTNVQPLVDINTNYAAVMPFGFIGREETSKVVYNSQRQWYGETKAGGRNYVEQLHKKGIKVMIKPHIWIRHGQYTGHLKMDNEEDWKELETTYRNFILEYARLAQEEKVAIFSVGVELEQFVINRPDFWKNLIKEVKAIYKGKVTYASNWDEYSRVPFWDQLDYIGIDSYFPISEEKTPSVEQAKAGWRYWKEKLASFSKENKKQVLFTEWGYRSMDYTGKEPWVTTRGNANVNLEAQANATQAVFETFWQEDWFAGGFVWKWFIHHERSGGVQNDRFTPQNKPAQEVIKKYYGIY